MEKFPFKCKTWKTKDSLILLAALLKGKLWNLWTIEWGFSHNERRFFINGLHDHLALNGIVYGKILKKKKKLKQKKNHIIMITFDKSLMLLLNTNTIKKKVQKQKTWVRIFMIFSVRKVYSINFNEFHKVDYFVYLTCIFKAKESMKPNWNFQSEEIARFSIERIKLIQNLYQISAIEINCLEVCYSSKKTF